MDNSVLSACKRGHDAACSENAAKLIKDHGMTFIGQMMIGLPSSSRESEILTANKLCELEADGVRIYPTAVFAKTELAKMAERGEYTPLNVNDAVLRTANVMDVFVQKNIPIIRIGLCESDGIHKDDGIIAGAFHPALGELCESEFLRRRFEREIEQCNICGSATVHVAPKNLSKAIGQHKENIKSITEKYSLKSLKIVPDKELSGYEFKITQTF